MILLITFGSLIAAGMPLITAGLGLITGVALIGLATHVTSMSNVSPQLALMIGLGVGIDYALFIVTRFRENYLELGDVERSVLGAMDTSGRAILLAGATVVIALLGMFATGVSFMYGLAIASVIAVLLTLAATLTLLPALLSRFGARLVRSRGNRRDRRRRRRRPRRWRRAGRRRALGVAPLERDRARPPVAAGGRFAGRDGRDAAPGVRAAAGHQRRRQRSHEPQLPPRIRPPCRRLRRRVQRAAGARRRAARARSDRDARGGSGGGAATPGVTAVTEPQVSPTGALAVMQVYPRSAPQAPATTDLVNRLRHRVLPALEHRTGVPVLVGGLTAGSIDFSQVLSSKLPLFIAVVVLLSALLLFIIFRSLVIPIQAAVMNLLSIGGAIGATVAVFQWGWLGGLLGVQKGPVEPWIPC